ncbi:NADP-dependent oxidoreductase domain-containing protein [Gymnopilus junonius]|uniref:NADP-dependent oxidoreductase domain-containing protein n=1 Tax=Gymnopilus junonius TaxID=109634 RepID=A0A9P5NII0_GYMJU|nr:NADP-dependent oxidoreductase domain-containing protein [Gymnopilus junonius]
MPWDSLKLNDGMTRTNSSGSNSYGTWRTGKGQPPVDSLKQAFAAGIHHVDTAQNYTNEPEAGIAIRESGIPREQIFVTTKWSRLNGLDIATSFQNSLKNLGLSYIDLYLIHGAELCDDIPKCWKEMEKIKDSGLARQPIFFLFLFFRHSNDFGLIYYRSIGVSNFEVQDLQQLLAISKHVPVVNQILFHPYVYEEQLPILKLCAEKSIVIEAYSPLIPVTKRPGGPVDKPVSQVAQRLGVSMDQVLLAWAKAKGTVPVTMSAKKERVKGYVKAGDLVLSSADIDAIDKAGAKGVNAN